MSKPVILCVDDEVVILDSLKVQLKQAFGDTYSYEMAESVDEAIEIIEESVEEDLTIIAIVSDWLMPNIKGDEFLIRVHQRFPWVIKIMLTGQADEKAIERATEQPNLHRCIHKPWAKEELVEAIESGLIKL